MNESTKEKADLLVDAMALPKVNPDLLFPDSEVKNEDPTIGCNCVRGMSVKTENFIFLHHVATGFGTPKVVSAGQLFFPASFCLIFWSTSIDFSRVPASFCVMPWNTSL